MQVASAVMRGLTLLAPGRVEWREIPSPKLADSNAALVRPIAVGVCDFDRAIVAGVLHYLPLPIVLGHEIVGEVTEAGASVTTVKVGDKVILPMQVSCGHCPACHDHRTNSCDNVPRLSNYGLGEAGGGYGGGMSDLLSVPYADAMLVKVPEGLTPVDCVAMGCNLTEAYRCLAPIRRFPGAAVLVLGGYGPSIALSLWPWPALSVSRKSTSWETMRSNSLRPRRSAHGPSRSVNRSAKAAMPSSQISVSIRNTLQLAWRRSRRMGSARCPGLIRSPSFCRSVPCSAITAYCKPVRRTSERSWTRRWSC